MAHRKNVYVIRRTPTDPGESPNRYVGQVTAEIRLFFPPHTDPEDIRQELREAYYEAEQKLMESE